MAGVSWTGGRPKVALTRGSRVTLVVGLWGESKLGVSITGGRTKVALDLRLGGSAVGEAGAGEAGVTGCGLAVPTGLECSGGGSWVGIL